ncbi:MAG: ATP-binding protein [Lachnospiraceae bacterium]|nr:ATP-binding protein [Lachnospiraceae bacterium]
MKFRNLVGEDWGLYGKTTYGKGICALFYGPPGTGKTMAAQVLANELGLDLYRIDLSRMMSKYIGETEKNISKLFERAANINALLFFDEADAFFSKRTQVNDSHDRSANGEVAHLLQKLEEYEGISVLATNLKDNMDDAFKRRIKYMIPFPFPDAAARKLLWHKMLPASAPREEELELDWFAENFEMAGSEIREVLMQAAVQAAEEGSGIRNSHIADAIRRCLEKYGKIVTDEEFGYLL